MSNYVVIARFDDKADKKLNKLRKSFTNTGYSVPQWPVHITIAAYENIDEKSICDWTADFCKSHNSVNVNLCSLGTFPPNKNSNVLFLAPAYSKTFVDFYYNFHQKYEKYCTGIGRYNSIKDDSPSIHCTIAEINTNDLQNTMKLVFDNNCFGQAKITALEVYTYPMKLIKRFELKNKV